MKQDRIPDLLLRFCSFIGNALPNFFVAMLFMQLFSIKLKLLPVILGRSESKKCAAAGFDSGSFHVGKVYAFRCEQRYLRNGIKIMCKEQWQEG